MVPNIYTQQLSIHSGEVKKNQKQNQTKKIRHKWPHLEFHSIFNQGGTYPHLKKKSAVWRAKGTDKKRGNFIFAPPPQRFSKPVVAWLTCSECMILKAGLFIQRNCWHSYLVKKYGRKAYSSESQTWSEKAYSDCSN